VGVQEERGLAEFVAARGPALLRLAWLLTTDGPAAEDLVQDALVRVIPKWPSIDPAAREAYLRTTIRTTWIDTWRRRGRGRFAEVPDDRIDLLADGPVDDEDIERLGDRAALAQALTELPSGQRAVVVLRYYEDQSEAQTARALGVSLSTVKSQARDGLRRLRTLMPPVEAATVPGEGR